MAPDFCDCDYMMKFSRAPRPHFFVTKMGMVLRENTLKISTSFYKILGPYTLKELGDMHY